MSIVCFYNIESVLGCLESFRSENWPQKPWNNEKLAQNPWNLALAHFSWLRSPPVGIICDVLLSILWTYNIWPIFGCVEFSRRKSCQELLQIMKNKLKTYLKSSYCLLRFTQVLSLGMICDISSKITYVDNMYGVSECFGVFQIPDSSLPERKKNG